MAKHLNKNGSVLFVENGLWSNPKTFKDMIEKGDLKLVKSFPVKPSRLTITKILLKKINVKNLLRLISTYGGVAVKTNVTLPHYFIWNRKID